MSDETRVLCRLRMNFRGQLAGEKAYFTSEEALRLSEATVVEIVDEDEEALTPPDLEPPADLGSGPSSDEDPPEDEDEDDDEYVEGDGDLEDPPAGPLGEIVATGGETDIPSPPYDDPPFPMARRSRSRTDGV